jgi:cytochrome b subunit of formate dehydrogenase
VSDAPPDPEVDGGPVLRHKLPDRIYHWVTAVAVLTLLATGFLPILGWKFGWVTPHWIAGVVLTAAVLFHLVRAVVWQDFWAMVVDREDLQGAGRALGQALAGKLPEPRRPGKYSILQKLFHLVMAVVILALVASGLVMLLKIDTVWWRRDPYWLSDYGWGVTYAVHGLCAMALISLLMAHIYFAFRPEKWWMTLSMIRGWISRADYEAHHDPARWPEGGQ